MEGRRTEAPFRRCLQDCHAQHAKRTKYKPQAGLIALESHYVQGKNTKHTGGKANRSRQPGMVPQLPACRTVLLLRATTAGAALHL